MYKVINWERHFEGAKSKTYNNKTSCSMPCKHGLGYRRLIRSKNGPALFGAWCALIQVLSRHEKPRQGYCTDTGRIDGVPYTSEDLEFMTDIPAKLFDDMLNICKSHHVGWVAFIKDKDTIGIPQGTTVPLNLDLDLDLDSNSNSASIDDAGEFWVSHQKRKLNGKRLNAFKKLWEAFGYKKGRAKAIDAFLNIPSLTDSMVREICESASFECSERERLILNGKTPIMLEGWINGRRWEDEHPKENKVQSELRNPTRKELLGL